MSAKGINDWLSDVMLDEEMMAQARHDMAATLKLSNELWRKYL
jgi:hypothetical protein